MPRKPHKDVGFDLLRSETSQQKIVNSSLIVVFSHFLKTDGARVVVQSFKAQTYCAKSRLKKHFATLFIETSDVKAIRGMET